MVIHGHVTARAEIDCYNVRRRYTLMRREFLYHDSDQSAPKAPAAFASPAPLEKKDVKKGVATIFGTRNMDDSVLPHVPAASKLQVRSCCF